MTVNKLLMPIVDAYASCIISFKTTEHSAETLRKAVDQEVARKRQKAEQD